MASGTLELIEQVFAPLAGRQLLDVGCGPGRLARQLADRGAVVTGLDPDAAMLAEAGGAAPAARFVEGGAESLPFASDAFDGVIFLNSLHHVPQPVMEKALQEAGRVLRPGACLVVVEPLLTGNFVPVLRIVDDESEVRTAAQAALDAAGGAALLLERVEEFVRRETFADLDAFAARIVQADAARAPLIAAHRAELEAAWTQWALKVGDVYALDQPLRAHIFRKAG